MMYFGRFALLSRYQLPIYLPFTARN